MALRSVTHLANQHEIAANDDIEQTSTAPKRIYQRRKPQRSDLRFNTQRLSISLEEYGEARKAYAGAYLRGLELDTMVTLRPCAFEDMTAEARWAWTKKWLNSLRQMFADNENLPTYAALWTRESKRIGQKPPYTAEGEHVHVLVHTKGKCDVIERTLRKRFGHYEVQVDAASYEETRLRCGWIVDAASYLLKAVSPQVYRFDHTVAHRKSGPIFGPRIGWSRNINPTSRPGRRGRATG